MKHITKMLGTALIVLVVAWFVLGGRISYAVTECSKGAGACMLGIAVALGIANVTDENGRCVGTGCTM